MKKKANSTSFHCSIFDNGRLRLYLVVLFLPRREGEAFHTAGLPGNHRQRHQTCHPQITAPVRLPSSLHVQQRPLQQSTRQNSSNRRRGQQSPAIREAIERNKKIIAFGKRRRVDDLFELFEKERKSFSHVNFATMLMQLQRIPIRKGPQKPDDPRLQDLLMEIGNHIQRPDTSTKWDARAIANVVYAMSKLTDFRTNTAAIRILDHVESDVVLTKVFQQGNAQSISNTLWAFAKQGCDSDLVFAAAERHIDRAFVDGNSQNIANTLWAFATQGYDSTVAFEAAESHIDRVFVDGNSQSIANTLWAFAKQGYDSDVFGTAERHIDRAFIDGNSQSIANILWAFATQGYDSDVVFAAAERHIDRVLVDGNSQSIANTLWAFAKQGYDSPVLFGAAERHIDRVFEGGNPQNIANTLWAFAKQGYDSDVVFSAAERHIDHVMVDGSAQEISNTLWAFAKQGYDSDVVFRAAECHIDRVMVDGNSQEIANILWAFATQGYDSGVVFAAAERHIDRVFVDGTLQTIANTLWAFAKQRYDAPVVFSAAERHIDRVLEDGKSQEIANTLWAFAKQGYDSPVVFGAAERHIDRVFEDGTSQNIANTLWAFAIQGWTRTADQRNTYESLWNKAKSLKWDQLSDEGKRQLLGTYILTVADLTLDVPQEWLNDSQRLRQKNVESRLQGDVSSILAAIGWDHDLEVDPVPHLIPGYLAIDIACSASKIAIEVDGPSHYLRNVHQNKKETPAEDGPTKAKRRLLTHLGWKVIKIPYFEWNKFQSAKEKKEYLSTMIAKVANNEPGCETVLDAQYNPAKANTSSSQVDLPATDTEGLVVSKMKLVNKEWTKATVVNMKAYLKHFDVKGMSGANKNQLLEYIRMEDLPRSESC